MPKIWWKIQIPDVKPLKPTIRYKTGEKEQIESLRQKYNRRIKYLKSNQNLKGAVLPETVSKSSLNKILTRKELNYQLNKMQRLFRQGAAEPVTTKGGIKTIKYLKSEASNALRTINRRRKKEREKILNQPLTYPNAPKGSTLKDAPQLQKFSEPLRSTDPKKDYTEKFTGQQKKEFKEFVSSVFNQSSPDYLIKKNNLFKENYFKALRKNLGGKAQFVINVLYNVSGETIFLNTATDPRLEIKGIYDEDDRVAQAIYLEEMWRQKLGKDFEQVELTPFAT